VKKDEAAKTEKEAEDPTKTPDKVLEEGEFKVTIKKLEMPVRPRGVLAE
jgi:hypothetical protein